MTESTNNKEPNLELIIDEDKWEVIIGMKPEFKSSENSWVPDPVNKKLYVGKFLVPNLDNIKYACWSNYHNGEDRNFNYF